MSDMTHITAPMAILGLAAKGPGFPRYVIRRFMNDECPRVAAALTYTSLLAAVPMLAIGFAIFSAFPAFDRLQGQLTAWVFDNLLPSASAVIAEQIDTFTANTSQLTTLGVVGLAVTAVLTLSTIEQALNKIWRVARPRPILNRLLLYWTMLTLGPLVLGASLSLSSYLFAVERLLPESAAAASREGAIAAAPFLLVSLGFGFLFLAMPNTKVHWRFALAGGVLAGALFEGLKEAFGLYVSSFPTYQTLYGAMAVLPIVLIWLYMAWLAVLIGAETAAAWPEWRARHQGTEAVPKLAPGARLALALTLVQRLRAATVTGAVVTEAEMQEAAGGHLGVLRCGVRALEAARLVREVEGGGWVLCRDLAAVPLSELLASTDQRADPADMESLDGIDVPFSVRRAVDVLSDVSAPYARRSLQSILDEVPAPEGDRSTVVPIA